MLVRVNHALLFRDHLVAEGPPIYKEALIKNQQRSHIMGVWGNCQKRTRVCALPTPQMAFDT
jgi:hypothetical protein